MPRSTRRAAPAASRWPRKGRLAGRLPPNSPPIRRQGDAARRSITRFNCCGGTLGPTSGLANIRAASGRRLRRQSVGAPAGRPAGQAVRPPPPVQGGALRLSLGTDGRDAAAGCQPGGRRLGATRLQHLHPRRGTAGPDRYRLQGRRQHHQQPGPDPGWPDALRRGVDERPACGRRAARSPKCQLDQGQAAVRSARRVEPL